MDIYESANRIYCGALYDALRFDINEKSPFTLHSSIKLMTPWEKPLFGPAFTCKAEPVSDPAHIDDTIRIKMFKKFYQGCIQVISSGGYRDVAQFGDISARIAKKLGSVGAIMDAPIRDVRIIRDCDYPVYGTGAMPIDAYGRWQITEYEVPITLPGIEGDVEIRPGDYIWGDEDGLIRIPADLLEEALSKAVERAEREDLIRSEIPKYDDVQKMYDDLGRW